MECENITAGAFECQVEVSGNGMVPLSERLLVLSWNTEGARLEAVAEFDPARPVIYCANGTGVTVVDAIEVEFVALLMPYAASKLPDAAGLTDVVIAIFDICLPGPVSREVSNTEWITHCAC